MNIYNIYIKEKKERVKNSFKMFQILINIKIIF